MAYHLPWTPQWLVLPLNPYRIYLIKIKVISQWPINSNNECIEFYISALYLTDMIRQKNAMSGMYRDLFVPEVHVTCVSCRVSLTFCTHSSTVLWSKFSGTDPLFRTSEWKSRMSKSSPVRKKCQHSDPVFHHDRSIILCSHAIQLENSIELDETPTWWICRYWQHTNNLGCSE